MCQIILRHLVNFAFIIGNSVGSNLTLINFYLIKSNHHMRVNGDANSIDLYSSSNDFLNQSLAKNLRHKNKFENGGFSHKKNDEVIRLPSYIYFL